ncbi:hypothetical protein [endosymbiont of unidentified scaly snail isolate Monju]|uniref:hypothetical protein n=1 Tax=endosymbiont of unidentified scaly snail isolate Monju TaxID=1248727 RepID=UPI000389258B|nr:hypothetical protein [endosymbiont of unidentified scaly snail isolate Monju]BAN70211.1 hypothetical protein EBS_2371 [endosymbiont of unidentified scaly snail isolate Monju]
MKIRWWHSLRLRIALVIFLLEAVLLIVVLWETQSHALFRARQLIQEQDDIALALLAADAEQAMMTLAYDHLTDLFRQAAAKAHIDDIVLTDERDIVLASSDAALLGRSSLSSPDTPGHYSSALSFENPWW